MMRLWQRMRGKLCGLLGHRYIGDQHRKLCVYCWKEVTHHFVPGGDDDEHRDDTP
jgi:hypothetical protein